MNIRKFRTNSELSDYASDLIVSEIDVKPNLLLCIATGNSPSETYQKLAQKKDKFSTEELRIIKLDEWGGISPTNPESCETYIRTYINKPLGITEENYIAFNSNPAEPLDEAARIQTYLDKNGAIDVCILGLGANGHIAFNEPSAYLQPYCHKATLTEKSMEHSMAKNMGNEMPTYGLTLGMANILQSKKIIMIIAGKGKEDIIKRFLSKEINTNLPASFLWLHPNVECLMI
ncbi:MAG: 6-phosphogluconolactonase [Paludibacter sp.]